MTPRLTTKMETDVLKTSRTIAVAALALLLAACSKPDRPPEDVVAERAQARWDAMVAQEFQRAWEYYSPGFREQTEPAVFEVQMSQRPVRWDSAELVEVECPQPEKCTARFRVGYTAVGAPGQLAGLQNERSIRETWVRLQDEWWYSALE